MFIHPEMEEAEQLLQHALTAVGFVEGEGERRTLEKNVRTELAKVMYQMDRVEEMGPQIERLRDLADEATAGPLEMVAALELAVLFQATRRDVKMAKHAMKVLTSDPIPYSPSLDS